jgi:branched-chain amino acid transport system permease protein
LADFILVLSSGLLLGSMYSLIGLGYSIIFIPSKIINFAQGELLMMGTMIAFTLHAILGIHPFLTVVLAISFGALLGLLEERLAIRPLWNFPSSIGWLMSTLGMSIILRNMAAVFWGKQALPFESLLPEANIEIFQVAVAHLPLLTITVAILILMDIFNEKTYLGKVIKATSIDREMAALVGVNITSVNTIAFSIGGALAALAGLLIAPITFASAFMGIVLGLKGFAAIVVGGIGSGRGTILGGFLIGIIEAYSGWLISAWVKDIVPFIIVILVLLLRPQGLMGKSGVMKF